MFAMLRDPQIDSRYLSDTIGGLPEPMKRRSGGESFRPLHAGNCNRKSSLRTGYIARRILCFEALCILNRHTALTILAIKFLFIRLVKFT